MKHGSEFDSLATPRQRDEHDRYSLFHKTELRLQPVRMDGVDLDAVAQCVAEVLGLRRDEVYVIDAIGDVLSLDILREHIDLERIAGKRMQLLTALARIAGFGFDERTEVRSDGVLGWIGMNARQGRKIAARTRAMADDIAARLARRVLVFSTGDEVADGQIVDSNKPFIEASLKATGYSVALGENLEDSLERISEAMLDAVHEGAYRLIVTTGGVGAERKDCTLEALKSLDPLAATPVIFLVERGHGRHAKDAVRIGVGQVGATTIVCLPGPHDEVKSAVPVLVEGLAAQKTREALAEDIASCLRARFQHRFVSHHRRVEAP
ncbi:MULTISPECIES: molybdopterin-binding protein [unclassified Burkholderia]|uniref:molybdopterin-binding protein n=1 Tax=unclassified Burkholderia TaxID=2613784 RepID=UPI000F563F57|nr:MULTISPECIES: molybdopterin-binding protein [unclassified Burkholderia]RQR30154.1 competence/damage-inducible protein A [Burkholderia sp. Bp9142]RQR50036.1 competence/damage-inducible protein A [Burkholderia sp. Bp9140]